MDKRGKVKYAVISILTILALVLGPLPSVSFAESLSGADSVTLVREPQQTPDGLGAAAFDGLQYADPAAQIDLVQPPVANNQGDAQVTHPLSVPPGRAGLQPDLALNYSSSGGTGWVGLGWDLSLGEVTIDTRWGVPRYDSAKESESYILDGDPLAPTAVRSTLLDRQTDRVFTRRVEGQYERIIRHGSTPGSYWWEVTDKAGTTRYYGATADGVRDTSAILADDSGHEFVWALKQVKDISSNIMALNYVTVTGSGVGSANASTGRDLYLASIQYTGSMASGVPNDPAYEVRFVRASQLGEPTRPDVSIDARGGFLRVTSDLLRHVDVYYRGTLTHHYVLNYSTGPFGKSLLANVVQAGSDGVEYARHTFQYYNDVGYNGSTTYNGFTSPGTWNTQDDGVGNGIDLGAFGSGNASAMGGVQSIGGDGRVYLGFNPFEPEKEGSFGAGLDFAGEDDKSLLEMVDINGDNLPDKVFKDSSGISYRLNTSGPNGTTTFGDKKPITGINNLSRESNFTFGVGPEAYFGVELMYNHAWTWSWGKTYFIDVNTDGLVDLVDNGTVYFNHGEANGQVTFSNNSADTSVPIDSGALDPSVLPDMTTIENQQKAQAPLQDTLRRWVAPWNGQVGITGDVSLVPPVGDDPIGDGVRVAIQHNGNELWSQTINGGDYSPHSPGNVTTITVSRGDNIYFRVGSRDDGASDRVSWDPVITYQGVSPTPDANGLDVYSYQGSQDFTLAGYNDIFAFVPVTGTVHIEGDFNKTHKTTDDITIQVLHNGAIVASQTIGRDATGAFPFTQDVDVLAKDPLIIALKIDSPVDLSAFSWTPRIYYTSATQGGQPLPVVDKNGQPIMNLSIPIATEIYPRTDLAVPQTTWKAPMTETITATTTVAFSTFDQDGTVAVTVKKKITPQAAGDPPSDLVAKQILTVQNGLVTGANPSHLTFEVQGGAQYWFDLSVGQPALGSEWVSGSINISSDPNNPDFVPSARHWSYTPEQVFPPSYRGWAYAGYNAAEGREEQAIDESRLVFDENDYPHDKPQLVGGNSTYPTSGDVDPNYKNPINSKAYFYAPTIVISQTTGLVLDSQWRGSKDNLFGSASEAGSSRVGPDSIGLPAGSSLAGASGVTRLGLTQADAIAGGIGGLIGGSFAWGHSEGSLDFFDMNGDQFPDVVGSGIIQYTTPRGALDGSATTVSQLSDYVRQDKSTTKTLSGGGTAAKISADSKGNSNTSQAVVPASGQNKRNAAGKGGTGHAEPAENELAGASLGLAGDLSWSSTNTNDDSPLSDGIESDLGDVNGDGLPDRITTYKDGSGLVKVAFNLGYGFSPAVDWSNGGFEQGYSMSESIGPTLGFSILDVSFAGGVSLGGSTDNPGTTWVDLNGDGLIDQLSASNGSVSVRFNTGAGLSSAVTWGAFQKNQIAQNHSISLGGGADVTIPIGPLCIAACYLIINPGVHITGGMSRQEIGLYDVDGDGYVDSIFSTADKSMDVSINTTGKTNLLESVANPLGGAITIDYTRKGNTTSEAFSQWVMSSVSVDDGRPGDGPDVQLTTYEYGNNIYGALERTFLGFDTVTERQRDTSKAGNPILRSYERVYRNATVFDSGLLASETLLDGTGNKIKDTQNTWSLVDAVTGAPVVLPTDPLGPDGVGLLEDALFPRLTKTQTDFYNNGAVAKFTYNTFEYDTLGNITQTVDVGEPDLADDDLIANTTYSQCQDSSWVSLPQTFEILDGNNNVLRSRYADDQLCTNGAVTTLTEDPGNGELAQTNLAFDAWGNYNQIIYPENATGQRYQVDYVYDADRHTDIAQVTDSFGLTGFATFDGPTGQIASQTDPNGQVTSYTYDPQGRLASITSPYEQGSGHATVTFEYFPTALAYAYGLAHHYDSFHPGDTIDTVAFLDGIGRETQTKQDATLFRGVDQAAEDVMVVGGAVEFDALGRAVKEWYPIEEPLGTIGTYNTATDTITPTLYAWSLTDHITKVTEPNGSTTTTSYGYDDGSLFGTTMFLVTRTDPLGKIQRTYSDIRDNLLASEVTHNGTPLRTTYSYDPLQELLQTTDPDQNAIVNTYDMLGRRTSTTTPDGGLVEFTYDPASQVTRKVTPNLRASGGQVSYTYNYNRLTGITYSDGTPNVAYNYGGPGAPGNGAGRIVQIDDGARNQVRAFGPLGELVSETTTMKVHNLNDQTAPRLTWTTAYEYDTWGRPKTITYPDGEVVTYGYDSGGLTNAMAGVVAGLPYTYITRMEYDKFLTRRFQETGNGVQTEIRYNDQTRRLERMITNAPGRPVQDIIYGYDAVGNVLTANNDAPTPVTSLMGGTSQQSFVYDDLYQLVSANGTYQFAPKKHRDYTYNLVYDNLGNIMQKTQTDTIFNNPKGTPQKPTTYSQTYDYNAAPHQPTHIGEKSYTYDLNGNLTGWTDDFNGTNRTVTWDAENRVTSVADQGSTTRYTYDDENILAIERGPQGETSFVNRYYTVHNGTVAWKNYWIGTQRIATQRHTPEDDDDDANTTTSDTGSIASAPGNSGALHVLYAPIVIGMDNISDRLNISDTVGVDDDYDEDDGVTEPMLYFFHEDLLSSTNFVTDSTGKVFEYLLYFPSGEEWVLEHSDIYRTPYLYAGSYMDEFRELNYFGARWYASQEQMLYSPDPSLVQTPTGTVDDPALLSAYSYAENNPMRLVDQSGAVPVDVQNAFRAAFAGPNGKPDPAKVRQFNALVQQAAEKQLGTNAATRLLAKIAANPKGTFKSAYKAFAKFGAKPLVEVKLTKTSDGFKLKSVKLGLLFKQFTLLKKKR
jgi:RHS repeat-associated protein